MRRLLLALMLLFGAAPGSVRAIDLEPRAELAGQWIIDRERSDDGLARLEREVRRIDRNLRPSRGRDAVLPRGTPRERLGEQLLTPLRLPERSIELRIDADAVHFQRDDGPTEILHTDGRPSVVTADSRGVHVAAWEDGVLWIERSSDRGTRVIEAWRQTAPGLAVDFEVRNGLFEEHVTFTLRFIPAANGEAR